MRKLTKSQFIERSVAKHGDKYDYSCSVYVNSSTKINIVCPEHGEFYQTPRSHMEGKGCRACSGNTRLTTEKFIQRALEVHGDTYDYSLVSYVNHKNKVDIICQVHGRFSQTANSHLSGSGCLKCGGKSPLDTQSFTVRAQDIHGLKYDYSSTRYVNMSSKVEIKCPVHGPFEQTPGNHLSGKGCSECGGTRCHSKDSFLIAAAFVHGDAFTYPELQYVNNRTPISIECPIHGVFLQTPHNHLGGKGCPSCASHGFNPDKQAFMYFLIDTETHSRVKIGVSNTPDKRFAILKRGTPFAIERIDLFATPPEITLQIEKFCHSQLESCDLQGFDGATEWFKFDGTKIEALREFIKSCGGVTT